MQLNVCFAPCPFDPGESAIGLTPSFAYGSNRPKADISILPFKRGAQRHDVSRLPINRAFPSRIADQEAHALQASCDLSCDILQSRLRLPRHAARGTGALPHRGA